MCRGSSLSPHSSVNFKIVDLRKMNGGIPHSSDVTRKQIKWKNFHTVGGGITMTQNVIFFPPPPDTVKRNIFSLVDLRLWFYVVNCFFFPLSEVSLPLTRVEFFFFSFLEPLVCVCFIVYACAIAIRTKMCYCILPPKKVVSRPDRDKPNLNRFTCPVG